MLKLRLIDAVIVAAVAMLSLKVLGLVSGSPAPDQQASKPAQTGPGTGDDLPSFARVLAYARTGPKPIEVATTGTVAGQDTGTAAGQDPGKATDNPPEETPGQAVTANPGPAAPASSSERAILERLGQRRNEWQQRSKDLEMRERLLENAEQKLEARINDLKSLEEKADTAAKRGDTEAAGLKNLVTMYEAMKPKDAARVFDRLSHDVLVSVVLQMNPRKMAEILAAMSPEAAERLTVALATRAKGGSQPAVRGGTALPSNELPAIDPSAGQP